MDFGPASLVYISVIIRLNKRLNFRQPFCIAVEWEKRGLLSYTDTDQEQMINLGTKIFISEWSRSWQNLVMNLFQKLLSLRPINCSLRLSKCCSGDQKSRNFKEWYSAVMRYTFAQIENWKSLYKQLVKQLELKRFAEPNKVVMLKNNKIVSSVRSGSANAVT